MTKISPEAKNSHAGWINNEILFGTEANKLTNLCSTSSHVSHELYVYQHVEYTQQNPLSNLSVTTVGGEKQKTKWTCNSYILADASESYLSDNL